MAGARKLGLSRWLAGSVIGGIALLTVALLYWRSSATAHQAKWQRYLPATPDSTATVALDRTSVANIEAFCGDCHGLPLGRKLPPGCLARQSVASVPILPPDPAETTCILLQFTKR